MNHLKHRALSLTSLMLLSILLSVAPHPHHLATDITAQRSGTTSDHTFTTSTSEISGTVGSPITPTVPVHFGSSMTQGGVNLSLQGTQTSSTTTYSVATGLLNGTLNATVNDGNTVELVSSSSGPSQAGTNSSTVLSSTSMSGTHTYDTLELLCGIASCGSIVATGDLTLYVNTLRLEQGTSILANDLATGGLGAGTSTTTATNGRNDGGGGAGHGGVGGAGGGNGGGSGGSAYGNGTERGSQGGGVSSSYHSAANGGSGGGYLRIFADQVIVNGTVQANGGNGDAGSQASSGTGAGGSGAGGGSGGSVFIQANSLTLSNAGIISANGGTGGNGANGAQNGPGFGMYDGGDGGGGGGGGRIVIKTQAGGYTNGGTITAASGSGGSLGYKYGTGIDGVSGAAGGAGTVATSTWAGYISTGNTTANNGTFTTHPLNTQTGGLSPAYVQHTANIPATGSLSAVYRFTINGSDGSFDEWSAWAPLSMSGEWIPAHRWLQIEYNFSRTGSTSPTLSAMSLQTSAWTTLTSVDFAYDGQGTLPSLNGLTVGHTTTLNNTGNSSQAQFSLDVPSAAMFSDDLSVWMQWEEAQSGSSAALTGVLLDGTTVWSENAERAEEGYMLTLDRANLTANAPSSTWMDNNGLQWSTYDLEFAFSQPTNAWYDHLSLPWSFSVEVNLTGAVNDAILENCGTFYAFTAGSCYGQSTLHRFTLSGSTLPAGSPAFTFDITDPSFEWEDAYAPQLSNIEHRQGIVQQPDLRVNETFSIVLFDIAGEDDLTVEYLGLDWDENDGFSGAQTMFHHNGLNGYYIYLNSESLDVNDEHQLNMTFRLLDASGNELLPRPTYQVDVYPTYPAVASFDLTGPTSIIEDETTSTWGVDGAEIMMTVGEAHHRSNLNVTAALTPTNTGQSIDLPLQWDASSMAYIAMWQPDRSAMGEWQVELMIAERSGLMAAVEDGYQAGVDAILHLVDIDAPTITNVALPPSLEPSEPLTIALEWNGVQGETYDGSIAIVQAGIELANKTILPTQASNASLFFSTEGWQPGTYEVEWWLQDDAGNHAINTFQGPTSIEVLVPLITANLSLQHVGDGEVNVAGEVESRSGNATLLLALDDGSWSLTRSLVNGQIELSVTLEGFSHPDVNLTARVCDAVATQACETVTQQFNFDELFAMNASHQCTTTTYEHANKGDQTLVSCEVENGGRTDVVASLLIAGSTPEGLSVDGPLVVASGANGLLGIHLPSTTLSLNETISWSIIVEDFFGTPATLETGTFTVDREPEQPAEDVEDSVETSGDSAGSMTMIVGVILLLAIGGLVSYRTVRKEEGASPVLTSEERNEARTKNVAEIPEVGQEAEDGMEELPAMNRPSSETPATSVDEHGYEWYSADDVHWYRTEGTHGEWLPYQP